ncbi:hypothetical protein BGX27_003957, partial [Mortierella sp. AM989]
MRISTFVPAILGLALFTASTQALPAPHEQEAVALPAPHEQEAVALPASYEQEAVALLKRDDPGVATHVDLAKAVANIFIKYQTKVFIKHKAFLKVKVCEAIKIKLKVNHKHLGKARLNLKELEVEAKLKAEIAAKAAIDAAIDTHVIKKIDYHVVKVIKQHCNGTVSDKVCLHGKAEVIVVDIIALINLDIKSLIVKIKVEVEVAVKLGVKIFLENLCVKLGLIKIAIIAKIKIHVKILLHIKIFVHACIIIFIKVKLFFITA